MAIYHMAVKTVSRSTGRSSVGAAAYRSGESIKNEFDGVTHDYAKKTGIAHSEIMLPENTPKEYRNRSVLWNAVERMEKRTDARTAREVEVALPNELDRQEQIELVRQYARENFISRGMCADISIHAGHMHKKQETPEQDGTRDRDIKPDNPHAHIMLTTRAISGQGFSPKKNRDWDKRENVLEWRENWAASCNREFERKNLAVRIDHRSLQEQGITDRHATIHLGVAAHHMEKRGIQTEKGDYNREAKAENIAMARSLDEVVIEFADIRRQRETADNQLTEGTYDRAAERRMEAGPEKPVQGQDQPKTVDLDSMRNELAKPVRREALGEGKTPNDDPKEYPIAAAATNDEQDDAALDRTGAEMGRLKTLYIQSMHVFESAPERHSELNLEISKTHGDMESLEKHKANIAGTEREIGQLRAARGKLRFWNVKEKRSIDRQASSLQQSKTQAESSLMREHGITTDKIPMRLHELKQKATAAEKAKNSLPGREKLREIRNVAVHTRSEYIRHKIIADNYPPQERRRVAGIMHEHMAQAEKQGKVPKGEIQDRGKRESELRNISPEEYRAIKGKLPPHIQERLNRRDQQNNKGVPSYARSTTKKKPRRSMDMER